MKAEQDENDTANVALPSSDKKSFLLEYEGPTQLYRIIHHRHQSDPCYLSRNIDYHRPKNLPKQKDERSREEKAARLHALTKQLEVSGTPVGSSESLCMKFNGVTGVEKRGREFVPVLIRFLGNSQNKRKGEGEKELWSKETVLMLNPKRNDFSEIVKIPMNEIEHANRVQFKLDFPEEKLDNGPEKKRKRLAENGTARNGKKNFVFYGKVTACMELDSPIKAGEYEVSILSDDDENEKLINGNNQIEMMKPIAKVRKWETISGGAEVDILETAMPNFAHVRFNLDWVTAISHISKDVKRPVPSVRRPDQIKVIYQMYYQNRARVVNETRNEPRCIWCERQLYTVQDLFTHLRADHMRFLYSTPEQKALDNGLHQTLKSVHIEVYPNPWKIHSYLGNPNLSESLDIGRCIFYRGKEPIKRINARGTQVLIWRSRPVHPSSQPDQKGVLDRTECSLITQGHRRLYFHTHSNMPVRACEFDVDSEDDTDQEFRWIRENMFNQINEFTDVNKDEKLVMQLWNHFLMSRKVLSMAQIHQACHDIAHQYGAFILKQNLRRNFLLHLLNLVDHCLLKASKVPDIMVAVDQGLGSDSPDFTGAGEERDKLLDIINNSTSNDYNYFL